MDILTYFSGHWDIGKYKSFVKHLLRLERNHDLCLRVTTNHKKTRTSRSFKVSNWDILEFRSQSEIRTFIFLNTLDYGTLINKEIETISNNFDVLCWNSPRCCPWSSPDGWIRFLDYKTCRKISQEDSVKKLGWLIYKWRRW